MVAIRWVRRGSLVLEMGDHRERVGQQPFQLGRMDGSAVPAILERVVGTYERFVEKMIEAKPFGSQGRGHGILAKLSSAVSRRGHLDTPQRPRILNFRCDCAKA